MPAFPIAIGDRMLPRQPALSNSRHRPHILLRWQEVMMHRFSFALILVPALCVAAGCAQAPLAPLLERPAPARAAALDNCGPFLATTMAGGQPRIAGGTACRQPDGALQIIEEDPLPDAAIALGTPLPDAADQTATVYYPYDPRAHASSWLEVGGGYGDDGRSDGGFRRLHRFHHGFLGRGDGWR
jgi:hypothetical protein